MSDLPQEDDRAGSGTRADRRSALHALRGADLVKLVSRFAMPKSEEARLDALADPSSFAGVDENDPKSVAQVMKKMGREMGEDLGDDFDQAPDQEMSSPGNDEGFTGGDDD
jgi:hypothetical protein